MSDYCKWTRAIYGGNWVSRAQARILPSGFAKNTSGKSCACMKRWNLSLGKGWVAQGWLIHSDFLQRSKGKSTSNSATFLSFAIWFPLRIQKLPAFWLTGILGLADEGPWLPGVSTEDPASDSNQTGSLSSWFHLIHLQLYLSTKSTLQLCPVLLSCCAYRIACLEVCLDFNLGVTKDLCHGHCHTFVLPLLMFILQLSSDLGKMCNFGRWFRAECRHASSFGCCWNSDPRERRSYSQPGQFPFQNCITDRQTLCIVLGVFECLENVNGGTNGIQRHKRTAFF